MVASRMARPCRWKYDRAKRIDLLVGSRLRLRRNMLGISQERLAAAIGVAFQQVQKYESGVNRIYVGHLYELCRLLDVAVSFFFDDADPVRAPAIPSGFSERPTEAFEFDPLHWPETLELVEAYYAIDDAAVRRCLLALAEVLAEQRCGPSDLDGHPHTSGKSV
jgi:transcriptional regulator with XRE-family HTH domain